MYSTMVVCEKRRTTPPSVYPNAKNVLRSLTTLDENLLLPSSNKKMRLQRLTRKPASALARPSSERARSLAPAASARGGPRPRAVSPPPPRAAATVSPPADFQAWAGADIKKRTDIKSIMILGAGPIVIGQV